MAMKFCCLTLVILYTIAGIESISFKNCTTIDDKQGQCVLAKNCPGNQYSKCPGQRGSVCCEDKVNPDGFAELNQTAEVCGSFWSKKVMGGREVEIHSRPWMALLMWIDPDEVETIVCGGTLITSRFVLSAAHCFLDNNRKVNLIRLGEHNINKTGYCRHWICEQPHLDIGVERIIKHEFYNPKTRWNDIALVKMDRYVKFNEFLIPICLPLYDELQVKVEAARLFMVTGWGNTEKGTPSNVLMEVKLPKAKRLQCTKDYGSKRPIGLLQLCVGSKNEKKDSCAGDSGGPLSYPFAYYGSHRFVQAGIVSYGRHCGSTVRGPGVYTNVGKFIPWISRQIVS